MVLVANVCRPEHEVGENVPVAWSPVSSATSNVPLSTGRPAYSQVVLPLPVSPSAAQADGLKLPVT